MSKLFPDLEDQRELDLDRQEWILPHGIELMVTEVKFNEEQNYYEIHLTNKEQVDDHGVNNQQNHEQNQS